jgi:lipopolysaccharide/colanic/teichoic acid biosynthesis glycosyltransferase
MEIDIDNGERIAQVKRRNLLKRKGYYTAPIIQDKEYLKNVISKDAGRDVYKFISDHVDISNERTILLTSKNNTAYENTNEEEISTIINLQPVNKHKDLNSYFKSINTLLPAGGIYFGCVESYSDRREKIILSFHPSLVRLIWALDFVFNRVLPKLPVTKHIFKFFRKNRISVISKTETLGRLCYEGFDIINVEKIYKLTYFAVVKKAEPKYAKIPSSGLLFKMKRVSKEGKIIGVYKIRTMHLYSEYLHKYIVENNGYNRIGKPNEDFRLAKWGKVIRRLYLDEMPQLINVIKGDLNIVGVRPISRFGFEALPEDLQKERIKYKPGCIPPNVALGITGFQGVIKAEKIYLRQMKKNALLTNIKYFLAALYNIMRRKSTSA